MSGVEAGKFSRAEPQSAPQNATSVIGDPAEHNSREEGDRKGTKGNSRGNPRALNSQWRWQILTNSTFCWRGVVPLFSRSSPALLSAEEGKV